MTMVISCLPFRRLVRAERHLPRRLRDRHDVAGLVAPDQRQEGQANEQVQRRSLQDTQSDAVRTILPAHSRPSRVCAAEDERSRESLRLGTKR